MPVIWADRPVPAVPPAAPYTCAGVVTDPPRDLVLADSRSPTSELWEIRARLAGAQESPYVAPPPPAPPDYS